MLAYRQLSTRPTRSRPCRAYCTRSTACVLLEWKIYRPDSVIAAVISLNYSMNIIREASEHDLDRIVEIWTNSQQVGEEDSAILPDRLNHVFQTVAAPFNFGVSEGDCVEAFSSLLPIYANPIKSESHAEISLYSDSGIAKNSFAVAELANATLQYARRSPLTDVWAFIANENIPTQKLAGLCGMHRIGKTSTRHLYHLKADN